MSNNQHLAIQPVATRDALPQPVANQMLEHVRLRASAVRVLVCGGTPELASVLIAKRAIVDVIERAPNLRTAFEALGCSLVGNDLLDVEPVPRYDFVVLFAPADIEVAYTRHAFAFLKPGATLVTVLAEDLSRRTDLVSQAFVGWRHSLGALIVDLSPDAFPASVRSRSSLMILEAPPAKRGGGTW